MSHPSSQFKDTLLRGSIAKNIFNLALPIITAHLFANIYYLADMMFVGRIGPSALAAVSMGAVLMSITWTLLIGLAIAASSLTARFYGAQNREMVEKVALHSLIIAFFSSVILLIIGIFATPFLLKMLGGSEDVFAQSETYTKIVFGGAGGLIFLFITNSLFRGSGDVKTPMITLAIASLINIILDPLLIFGIGPFPELGVKGAAIATVIGQVSGALLNLTILLKRKTRIRLPHQWFPLDAKLFKTILRISLPGSLQNFIHTVSGLVIMRLVTAYGTGAVAAYGIGIRIDIMIMLPGWAIGAAVATILGQNLGAGQPDRAEKTGWHGVGFYFILLLILSSALWFGSREVIMLFNSDPQVVLIGSNYIKTVSIGYLSLSIVLILTMAMNGAGYTVVPMLLGAFSYLVFRIPSAIMLSDFFQMGTQGLWIAISGSFFVQAVLTSIWFRLGHWKHNKV